jgi:hypothetical protein
MTSAAARRIAQRAPATQAHGTDAIEAGARWTDVSPDMVMSQPSNGRETVSICPILHDEFNGRAAAAG